MSSQDVFSPLPDSLTAALRAASPFALAFSGGLDSRFLAHAAQICGASAHLYHIRGPHVPEAESGQAERWAGERNFPFTILRLDPLDIPEVRAGSRERCYGCKRVLFQELALAAARDGFTTLCDGSNASDQALFRPGIRALRELGVISPLAEAGLDKETIRRLGVATGLDRPDQQARPCLLTRYAYGLTPDAASLEALARSEAAVGALLARAFSAGERGREQVKAPDFRLRLVARDPARMLPFAVELHLDGTGLDSAGPEGAGGNALELALRNLAETLADAVEAEGFARPRVRVPDRLSGHYDAGVELL